jgi:hypothetical protein
MTKYKYILAAFGVTLAVAGALWLGLKPAAAACGGALPTTGGTATFTVNVPSTGNYRFWTHLYASSASNNGVYLRVDTSYCQITVGDNSSLAAGQFTWVDYQGGSASNKVGLDLAAGNHTVTFAGLEDGVGVDKVLLTTDTACVPSGDGSNCANASTSDSQPVSGTISLPTATGGGTITYTLNGKPVDGNQLDTSKLKDGTYTLQVTETDANGKTTTRTEQIVVANAQKTGWRKTVDPIKKPIILLPTATVLLLASGTAALWVTRPMLLQSMLGKITRISNVLSRKPYWGPEPGLLDNGMVVSSQPTSASAKWWGIGSAIGFGAMGIGFIALTFAATMATSYVLSGASLSGSASLINQSSAIGGKMVRFASSVAVNPTPTPPSPTPTPTPTPPTGCAANEIGTPPNCYPKPPAPLANGKSWKLSYNEDFNGTTLNTSKLTPCFDWNYGGCTSSFNQGKETYQPGQVRISGGTAKLVAEPLSPPESSTACYNNSCTYKAGLVSTARPQADNGSPYLFPFTYGYVESRMKFPGVAGFFTAFWMLPTDPSYNYDHEIDIVEILGGYPDTIFMTNHYNNRSDSYTPNSGLHNNGACPVKNYSTNWVTFGMDWTASHVAWYIDGVKCGEYAGADIPSSPMQIILHMMVDNNWERSWGSVLANQSLSAQLEVDYLRIYQQQ